MLKSVVDIVVDAGEVALIELLMEPPVGLVLMTIVVTAVLLVSSSALVLTIDISMTAPVLELVVKLADITVVVLVSMLVRVIKSLGAVVSVRLAPELEIVWALVVAVVEIVVLAPTLVVLLLVVLLVSVRLVLELEIV